MARPNFNADLQVRQQYMSLLYHKIAGEAEWTLIDQGRVSSPEQTAEEKVYNRIGDENKTKVAGQIETNLAMSIYLDSNVEELARFLGTAHPPGGWAGTEEIKLDPTKVADLKIVNFDGVTTDANILFTEYINRFRPMRLSTPLDADGDVRIVELSGSAVAYYIIPTAGV